MEMQAAVLRGPGDLEVTRRPRPACPPGGLLVAVRACSLCATDAKMFARGHRDLVLPRILGHEVAGVVAEAGAGVTDWRPGEAVQVAPGLPCGGCRWCLRGAPNMCERMRIIGFHEDGGLAQYLAVPAQGLSQGAVNRLPAGLGFAVAALAEPLACCLNALEQVRLEPGETVAVFGAGPQGRLVAQAARLRGASRLILVEVAPARLDRARLAQAADTGADVMVDASWEDPVAAIRRETQGRGADVVLPATGAVEALTWGLAALAQRGRLCLYSGLPPEGEAWPVNLNRLHYREATLVGAYGCTSRQNALALELLGRGRIDGEALISHRLPLARAREGLELVRDRAGMKVVVEMPG